MTQPELDLEPIKERLEHATDGPWDYDSNGLHMDGTAITSIRRDVTPGHMPAHISRVRMKFGDAEFIINSPTDIANLIAEVERLRDGRYLMVFQTQEAAQVAEGLFNVDINGNPIEPTYRGDSLSDGVAVSVENTYTVTDESGATSEHSVRDANGDIHLAPFDPRTPKPSQPSQRPSERRTQWRK